MTGRQHSLYEFECQGRRAFVESIHFDLLTNHLVPLRSDEFKCAQEVSFLADRARSIHGTWPVHVILPEPESNGADASFRFDGVRVSALCCSFPKHDVNSIEKLIVVWHQDSVQIAMPDAVRPVLQTVPWTHTAETWPY